MYIIYVYVYSILHIAHNVQGCPVLPGAVTMTNVMFLCVFFFVCSTGRFYLNIQSTLSVLCGAHSYIIIPTFHV